MLLNKEVLEEINHLEGFSKSGESYTNTNGSYGWRNPIREDTGKILQSLVIAKSPKSILEIGTAHGLSALYLYLGISKTEEFIFDTIEFDPLVANDTQERFDKLNIPIKVLSGEAMEVISKLETNYDLVFFDAQKSHYFKQLNLLIERGLIGKNTLLLADNVIDRQDECADFLNWFKSNKIKHTIIPTECGLLVATL